MIRIFTKTVEPGSQAPPKALDTRADSGQSRGRKANGDWASRFRKASAAKRRAADGGLGQRDLEQGHAQGARVAETDRQSARELDPTDYLKARGYTVKREGQHLSVRADGDEVYRVTRQQDGSWLWCDLCGKDGGDNIDLVREIEPRLGYAEAVYKLSSAPTVRQQPRPSEPKRQPPQLPAQGLAACKHGREYLQGRGISPDTIEYAEKAGMLRYADGGVLFVGYDGAGTAQSVTRRATNPDNPVQKRELRGSDKRFPPILPGDPAKVWIVEGGVDALALHDLTKRAGQPPPTVIVSGGANVLRFITRDTVQALLKQAAQVTIAGEIEKNSTVQMKADAGHKKQAQRVAEVSKAKVLHWTPAKDKDLAEMNYRECQLTIAATAQNKAFGLR